jgi:hypothetical protein
MENVNPCNGSCQLGFDSGCHAARSGVIRYCQLIAAEIHGNTAHTTYKSYIEEATAQRPPQADDDELAVPSSMSIRANKIRIPLGLSHRPNPNCAPCKERARALTENNPGTPAK